MIITIEGIPNEGKTAMAKKICQDKKAFFVYEFELNDTFWTQSIEPDTEIIVIDDVRNYETTLNKFKKRAIKINRQAKYPFYMKMPDIILIKFYDK